MKHDPKWVDYLEIPTKNIKTAKTFFGAIFDWTFVDYGPDYCSFFDGRIEGGFFTSEITITSQTSVLIVFYNDDLEGAIERILSHGGQIVREIFQFPGGERFHFSDPNGNEYAMWRNTGES